ncbi:methyltransferase domain-containing protein [Kitasatospora sp. NPDC058406]|uniref:methyltransferase domain-containing protein n=1 Tax=Kitasatospora sp. NPDC058406 TaxID=3346483 RepID=UPI00365DB92B
MTGQRSDPRADGSGRTAEEVLAAARAALADRQDEEADASVDGAAGDVHGEAVGLLVHRLLDAVDPVREAKQHEWITARQNADGGFPRQVGGPSDLSTTVLTHLALQVLGRTADHAVLDRAARFTGRHGGIRALEPEPAHLLLAITGAVGWNALGLLPPELLVPSRAPAAGGSNGPSRAPAAGGSNGPSRATAAGGSDGPARALAAAVGVLGSVRPVRELPIETEPLRVGRRERAGLRRAAVTAVLRTAHALGRTAPPPLRRDALGEAERLLLDGQESAGNWGGDRPHTAVCALALWALGHGTRHPAVRAALDALARQDVLARPAAAVDAAVVLRALAAAGERAGSDPAVDRALDRLLSGRDGGTADRPVLAPMSVSDVAGTALVLTALHAVDAPRAREVDTAVAEGVLWLLGRQSANGGWSRDGIHRSARPGRWAAAGPGVVAPPEPGVTAHVVEALCAEGYGWHPAVGRAVRRLLAQQAVEGFWNDGRGGRLRETSEVLLGLEAAGIGAGHLAVEGAMEWIYQQQNPDGGWSEDTAGAPGTPGRPSDPGTATPATATPSTVAQTARCVIAAHTTGVLDGPRTDAAVAFLLRHQRRSGDGPPANVRADALALWAVALHTRRSRKSSGTPTITGGPATAEPAEYDSWSTLWWQRRGPLAILHWCARTRAEHIPPARSPGALLVDVACGGGLLHPHIADKGYRHIGVDVSVRSAEVALRHGVDEVLIHDIHDIPLPDGCADVVVAGYCLEHVARPFDVIAECCRLLKPGGTLVMDTIAETFLARLSVITLGEGLPLTWAAPKGSHDHRAFIAPRRIVEACAAHGVPVDVFGVVPVVRDLVSWSVGRGYGVRMRSGKSERILYGVAGVKPLQDGTP